MQSPEMAVPVHPVVEAENVLPGVEPPPRPSSLAVFKLVAKKNLFLGIKRGRLIAALISICIQMVFTVLMYGWFKDAGGPDDKTVGRWLMAAFMPLNTLIGITQTMTPAVIDIVGEKEEKMKIIQNVYGLTESMYWMTWSAFYGLVATISITIIYIFWYAAVPILTDVNFFISFVIISSAFLQTMIFVFILTMFVDRAKTANLMATIIGFAAIACSAAIQFAVRKHFWINWIAGFMPIMNIYQSLAGMLWLGAARECDDQMKCRYIGASFETMFTKEVCMLDYHPSQGCFEVAKAEIFPLGYSFVMLISSTFFYVFLAWWLSNVWQGMYGTAKPKLFCFMPSYMCPKRNSSGFADAPAGIMLSIRNLRKEFKGGKVAVDNLSLEAYKGEIFAMLGHNGAGKTTAINCVVGLLAPTSGESTINGYDVRTSLDMARHQMSVCPQDNPCYEECTVRQHLMFFSALRGVPQKSIEQRVQAMLASLGLSDRIDHPCGKLSGGQKRRLWVATALIGDSPLAFLDEPTSGMDPSSRRELWSLLLRIRESGRCLIFTTHYLDEADILADRKAVLARGRVQAVGTSRDLKAKFGVGYRLSFELAKTATPDAPKLLESFVQGFVGTAKLENTGYESASKEVHVVTITMPFDQVGFFSELLQALDSSQQMLHVQDYALNMSSLEDVFLALGKQAEDEARQEANPGSSIEQNVDFQEIEADTAVAHPRKECSDWRSIKALACLRLKPMCMSRNRAVLVLLVPVMLQVLGLELSNLGASSESAGGNGYAFVLYPAMSFGVSLLNSSQDLILDLKHKCKYVSISQGLSSKAYWIGNFLAHFATNAPVAVAFLILFLVRKPATIPDSSAPLVILVLFFYPIPLQLFIYNLAALFPNAEVAAKTVPIVFMMTVFLPAMITWITTADFVPKSVHNIALPWHVVNSVLNPNYALPGCLAYLINKDGPARMSAGEYFVSASALPLYFLPVTAAFWLGNLIRLDNKSYANKPAKPSEESEGTKDEDVLAEERRCHQDEGREEAARYQGLRHTYRMADTGSRPNACAILTREFKYVNAVRDISLGVNKGECFSLLGPNGAGKTTTLGILTGEIRNPSAGKVSVLGHDMSQGHERKKAFELLGVCPQVDPIWQEISGKDHLMYYGRIKGVPEAELSGLVDQLLQRLGLEAADASKAAGTYSGGMKRKLSVAIALIGHSQMLFLDEPSAAVDAGAKRHLWKVIKLRGPDQTVVLTTHSMEEAEALSDRMAIQVRGQLRCLGTTMHIKSKYGTGYQLEVFLLRDAAMKDADFSSKEEELKGFVEQKISRGATLLESNAQRYLFQLPSRAGGLALGTIFNTMETNKELLSISDYSISQPSLEQVFLQFAKEQHEANRAMENS